MAELAGRQEIILKQLDDLRLQMLKLKETISSSIKGTAECAKTKEVHKKHATVNNFQVMNFGLLDLGALSTFIVSCRVTTFFSL